VRAVDRSSYRTHLRTLVRSGAEPIRRRQTRIESRYRYLISA